MPRRIEEIPAAPVRPADGHKGTFGRVLVIAGSRGMSGAACLAGQGALRGGAGLVFLAVPEGILPIVAGFEPSYLTIPLPDDADGRITGGAQEPLESPVEQADVIACGPGLGQSEDLAALAGWLYASVPKHLVVDADGLNLLARTPEILSQLPASESGPVPRILTPHPGEFSRLIDRPMSEILKNRESLAAEFAAQHGIVLVLKGRGTIITDGDRLAINTTGNSGLATGGSGDVLTGLIAAVWGQGLSAFDAAHFGVYLHGLAADLAAEDLSEPGLISSDLPHYIARAWKSIRFLIPSASENNRTDCADRSKVFCCPAPPAADDIAVKMAGFCSQSRGSREKHKRPRPSKMSGIDVLTDFSNRGHRRPTLAIRRFRDRDPADRHDGAIQKTLPVGGHANKETSDDKRSMADRFARWGRDSGSDWPRSRIRLSRRPGPTHGLAAVLLLPLRLLSPELPNAAGIRQFVLPLSRGTPDSGV